MTENRKIKILFFCTGNSCRSQMAEGWAKQIKSETIDVYSAGVRGSYLDPVVMNMMKAAGVDITNQTSKGLDDVNGIDFDYVIVLCEDAGPVLRWRENVNIVMRPFDDPPALAATSDTEEEALRHYIRIRDEIRVFVESIPESLEGLK